MPTSSTASDLPGSPGAVEGVVSQMERALDRLHARIPSAGVGELRADLAELEGWVITRTKLAGLASEKDIARLRDLADEALEAWRTRARAAEVRHELLAMLGPAGSNTEPVLLLATIKGFVPPVGRVMVEGLSLPRRGPSTMVVLCVPGWAAYRLCWQSAALRTFGVELVGPRLFPVADMGVADTALALWSPQVPDSAYTDLHDAVVAAHKVVAGF